MSQEKHHSHHTPDEGFEHTDLDLVRIVGDTVFFIAIIAISLFALDSSFVFIKEKMIYAAALQPESPQLKNLFTAESQALSAYKMVSDSTGVSYHIPIDHAIQLVAGELPGTEAATPVPVEQTAVTADTVTTSASPMDTSKVTEGHAPSTSH